MTEANLDKNDSAGPILVDRSLTAEEYELTRWMLENGLPEGRNFLSHLEAARVCSLCSCGCPSVGFSIDGSPQIYGPLHILGEFWFGSEDDRTAAEVIVFAVEGRLAGFEVTKMYDEGDDILPHPRDLRPC